MPPPPPEVVPVWPVVVVIPACPVIDASALFACCFTKSLESFSAADLRLLTTSPLIDDFVLDVTRTPRATAHAPRTFLSLSLRSAFARGRLAFASPRFARLPAADRRTLSVPSLLR